MRLNRLNPMGLTLAAALVTACAHTPPSAEMQQFDKTRQTNQGEQIRLRFPKLVENADSYHAQAVEAQDDREPEDMSHYGRLALLWWQSATARSDAMDYEAQRKQVLKETEQIEQELQEATKREKLARASLERMNQLIALEGKVADSEGVIAAREAINQAMAAIRDAQAKDADIHAQTTFRAAEGKLAAATDALGKGKAKDAQGFAIEAKATADAARQEAEPKYSVAEADQAKNARQRALFDAMAGIPGVSRAMVEGGVLVTVVDSFSTTNVDIQPGTEATFIKLAEVAKAYPDFSVVIEGHTDSKGSKTKNQQLSDTRAKSVMGFLAGQGVAPARMTAYGKGSSSPVADNKTKEGRAKNRRVELLFVASGK